MYKHNSENTTRTLKTILNKQQLQKNETPEFMRDGVFYRL